MDKPDPPFGNVQACNNLNPFWPPAATYADKEAAERGACARPPRKGLDCMMRRMMTFARIAEDDVRADHGRDVPPVRVKTPGSDVGSE